LQICSSAKNIVGAITSVGYSHSSHSCGAKGLFLGSVRCRPAWCVWPSRGTWILSSGSQLTKHNFAMKVGATNLLPTQRNDNLTDSGDRGSDGSRDSPIEWSVGSLNRTNGCSHQKLRPANGSTPYKASYRAKTDNDPSRERRSSFQYFRSRYCGAGSHHAGGCALEQLPVRTPEQQNIRITLVESVYFYG
jgi:hypothetical protein